MRGRWPGGRAPLAGHKHLEPYLEPMRPLPRSLVRQTVVRQSFVRRSIAEQSRVERRAAALPATVASVSLLLLAPLVAACASSTGASSGSADPMTTTARGCPAVSGRPALGAVIGTAIGAAQGPSPNDVRVTDPRVAIDEICVMMRHSAAAWNRGDLDAFVADYLPSEGTTFVGSKGVVRGPSAIRERYAARFAPGGTRDSLSFEFVEVDLLAPDVANTIAFYVLARGDSVVARGPTSLVMRRVNGRWKIVHDHSS